MISAAMIATEPRALRHSLSEPGSFVSAGKKQRIDKPNSAIE
jgi:hypothetical protein